MNNKTASGSKIANGSCRLPDEVISVVSVTWGAAAVAAAAPEFFTGTQNSVKVSRHGTLGIAVKSLGNIMFSESM
jgi:hypothetical protein